jgi:O-antigen/teichoic acid export membrane protein
VLLFALRAVAGSLLMIAAGLVAMSVMWPLASLLAGVLTARFALTVARDAGVAGRPRVVSVAARAFAVLLPGFGAVSLLSALEYQIDVILLSLFRSPAEVGIYSSAASMMYIAALAPQAYRMAVFPEFVRLREQPIALAAAVRRGVIQMTGLGLALGLAGALLAPYVIPLIFGAPFALAAPVVRVLIWNIVFMCANVPLVRYLMATGREGDVWRGLLASAVLNTAANLLLIPPYGAMGAVVARLASSAVFTAAVGGMAWRQSRRAVRSRGNA